VGWSRDGKWIYFHSNRSREDQLWRMPWPTSGHGEGAAQVTRKGGGMDVVESSHGRFAFYMKDAESDSVSVWTLKRWIVEPILKEREQNNRRR